MRKQIKRIVQDSKILHKYFAPGAEGIDLWIHKIGRKLYRFFRGPH